MAAVRIIILLKTFSKDSNSSIENLVRYDDYFFNSPNSQFQQSAREMLKHFFFEITSEKEVTYDTTSLKETVYIYPRNIYLSTFR